MPIYYTLICSNCGTSYQKTARECYANRVKNCKPYCSYDCFNLSRSSKKYNCLLCNFEFTRYPSDVKNSKNLFCSKSCAASYNNTHKTKGNRRSKLEIYLESELIKLYPKLDFKFNSKTTINSELDIYIPSLKLAFELNGIYHYEPIHGKDKLQQIQNNDNRKFQACLENNIELCIIDTSGLKYFKPDNAKKYLDIIVNIINSKSDSESN